MRLSFYSVYLSINEWHHDLTELQGKVIEQLIIVCESVDNHSGYCNNLLVVWKMPRPTSHSCLYTQLLFNSLWDSPHRCLQNLTLPRLHPSICFWAIFKALPTDLYVLTPTCPFSRQLLQICMAKFCLTRFQKTKTVLSHRFHLLFHSSFLPLSQYSHDTEKLIIKLGALI